MRDRSDLYRRHDDICELVPFARFQLIAAAQYLSSPSHHQHLLFVEADAAEVLIRIRYRACISGFRPEVGNLRVRRRPGQMQHCSVFLRKDRAGTCGPLDMFSGIDAFGSTRVAGREAKAPAMADRWHAMRVPDYVASS